MKETKQKKNRARDNSIRQAERYSEKRVHREKSET